MQAARRTARLAWGESSVLEWTPDGERRAPDVLLLHGGGLDSAELSWGEVGGALAAAGHRVVAPDLPGYGHSPRAPWPATQQHLLAHVDELTRALALDRVAIGGLSMGAGLALGHALAHPDRVAALMLLGAYGLSPRIVEGRWGAPAQLLSWAATRSELLTAISRTTARSRRMLELSLRPVVRDPARRTPELVDAVMAEAARGSGIAAFAEFQRDQVGVRRQSTDYRAHLPSIAAPTLFVHGERDTGVPVAVARRAAAATPGSRIVVVPDAGHWVQRDRPDAVVAAMLAHVGALPRSG